MSAGLDYYRTFTPPRHWEQKHRSHPERCADAGHPGNCYNPLEDRTWCLCGAVQYDGNTVATVRPNDCGGVLCECLPTCPTQREKHQDGGRDS